MLECPIINRKENMIEDRQFTITYYAKKHGKHITRNASGMTFADIGQPRVVMRVLHILI